MSSLSVELDAWIVSGARPCRHVVDLQWLERDPLVVTLVFGPRLPDWVVGRDLLDAGLGAPVGGHDVTVLPDPWSETRVLVVLAAPSGRCTVSLDAVDVDVFLQRTYAQVASDAVHPSDADLAGLLRTTEEGSAW